MQSEVAFSHDARVFETGFVLEAVSGKMGSLVPFSAFGIYVRFGFGIDVLAAATFAPVNAFRTRETFFGETSEGLTRSGSGGYKSAILARGVNGGGQGQRKSTTS